MSVEQNKETSRSYQRILIMTAVSAERDAVMRGLAGDARFDVQLAGVGPVAAAVSTAKALMKGEYDLVISAGIAGGFPGQADVCSIVVANEIIAADLGADSPEGFKSVDELGFGSSRVPVDVELVNRVTEALRAKELPVHTGAVLTLSTVTGTAEKLAEVSHRLPAATAEAMEGFGVAHAAHDRELPVLEIRTISNAVGPRDRNAWRIKDALDALEATSRVLVEVF